MVFREVKIWNFLKIYDFAELTHDTPESTGLLVYYPLNEEEGQFVYDLAGSGCL